MNTPFLSRVRAAWKRRVWIEARRRFRPEVELSLRDARFTVDLRDRVVGSLLYLDGEYEPEAQRLLRAMDLRGAVCVDVGAHMGLHTMLMSKLAGPDGRVFSFEPQSRNFDLLQRNIRANGLSNVQARRAAVGDRDGTCRMAVHPTNLGDHRVAAGGFNGGVEEVPMVRLDSVLSGLPGAIGLVKIDVQGYETHVIRGMRETLRCNPDAILMIEVFPEGLEAAGSSASELVKLLHGLGFDGWEFHDFRLIPCQQPHIYDLIRGGKYQDLLLSRRGERITEVLSRLYSERPLQARSPAVA